jgi:hypothetical protein
MPEVAVSHATPPTLLKILPISRTLFAYLTSHPDRTPFIHAMAHSNDDDSTFVDSSRLIGVSLDDTFARKSVRSQLRNKTTKVFVLETNGEEASGGETSREETDGGGEQTDYSESDDEGTDSSYEDETGSDGEEPDLDGEETNCGYLARPPSLRSGA